MTSGGGDEFVRAQALSRERLREDLAAVRLAIQRAAERSGRDLAEVLLVAVVKGADLQLCAEACRAGIQDLAENRIQALCEKKAGLEAAGFFPRWHMIGHLQRNKVRRFLATGAFLQSLDSLRLAEVLEERIEKAGAAPLPVLVEVNVSGEATKGGLRPDEVEPLLTRLARRGLIEARGLLAIAPFGEPEASRPHFRALRLLRDRLRERFPALGELSMGMTQDFEVAIEEGATMVRVGTALFSRAAQVQP